MYKNPERFAMPFQNYVRIFAFESLFPTKDRPIGDIDNVKAAYQRDSESHKANGKIDVFCTLLFRREDAFERNDSRGNVS